MNCVTLTMNPAVDISLEVGQLIPGKKLRCGNPFYEAGGGGINVARVIHELGGKATAVYTAGGPSGEMLKELLVEKMIEQQCIEIKSRTRENINMTEETSGQLFRLVMPGPDVSEDEQQRSLEAIRSLDVSPDYLVISGSLPPGVPDAFYGQVIQECRARGTRVILDTKAETLKAVIGDGVYLLKPNMHELSQLTGKELDKEKVQEQAARNLVDDGKAEIVVVSLGAAGVLVASNEMNERVRAPSVPIRSRVGAGDSMVGGLTLSLSQGKPVREAVQFGLAAGSGAVMTPGTQLCRREDVERLFAEME